VEQLHNQIKSLFYELMTYNSLSHTSSEIEIEEKMYKWLSQRPYYKSNPKHVGLHQYDDSLNRKVVWSLVKGSGSKTIVLIHHHDIVGIEDYGCLSKCAFDSETLKCELLKTEKDKEILHDLGDNQWIFGRGSADMRAAMAIHMGLIDYYSEMKSFDGNIIMISVPDEEYLSEGMRGAISLLNDLKENYDLEYVLGIDSEPHIRETQSELVVHTGSVGKLLPLIYVQGEQTHVSNLFDGLNPVLLMSDIVRRTEGNTNLADEWKGACTPPPTWSYVRDRKDIYDVSTPEAAYGLLSVLNLRRTPGNLIDQLKYHCNNACKDMIEQMDMNYWKYCRKSNIEYVNKTRHVNVQTYAELIKQLENEGDHKVLSNLESYMRNLKEKINLQSITIQEASLQMIEFALSLRKVKEPVVIIGFIPPYYPPVSLNDFYSSEKLLGIIRNKANDYFGLGVREELYFMGISDLSYLSLNNQSKVGETLEPNMPLWNHGYKIPFKAIASLQIPGVNIGPWGKDIHKRTERVYWKDVVEVVPSILKKVIDDMTSN